MITKPTDLAIAEWERVLFSAKVNLEQYLTDIRQMVQTGLASECQMTEPEAREHLKELLRKHGYKPEGGR
jgi:hypothetical protein